MEDIQVSYQKLKRYHELEKLIQDSESKFGALDHQLSVAKANMLEEQNDVVELENKVFAKFFEKLTNSYDDHLEQEKLEAILAENEFLEVRSQFIAFKTQVDAYVDEKKHLLTSKEEYYELLKAKLASMMDDTTVNTYKQSIERYQDNLEESKRKKVCIHHAQDQIASIEKNIDLATGAGVIDLVGVPFVGDAMKYANLGIVNKKMKELNLIINDLNAYGINGLEDETISILSAFDVFADNMILDAIALGKIISLKKKLQELENRLMNQLQSLRSKEADYLELIKQASSELEEYVVNA